LFTCDTDGKRRGNREMKKRRSREKKEI